MPSRKGEPTDERPVRGRGKTGIPLAAAAAGGGDKTLTVLLKIPQYLVRLRIFENGAKGHVDEQILAAFAVHIFAFAVRAKDSDAKSSVYIASELSTSVELRN